MLSFFLPNQIMDIKDLVITDPDSAMFEYYHNPVVGPVTGFVSYDNILSAQIAIQNLNGYHVGGKKLKVEIKRRKGHSVNKPY
jgi:hypothetical protein